MENLARWARSDPDSGLISRGDRSTPIGPNHTVPYGTASVFARIPGNKLPGYDHSVPPGRVPSVPPAATRDSPPKTFSIRTWKQNFAGRRDTRLVRLPLASSAGRLGARKYCDSLTAEGLPRRMCKWFRRHNKSRLG